MPNEGRWCGDAGEIMTFFFPAAGYITETVAQRSGHLRIEKHHSALGTIANMQCGFQKPMSLTPPL